MERRILTYFKLIYDMEYIITIIASILTIIILKFALQVKHNYMKKIKEIGYDKGLNDITNLLPGNKLVCEEILNKLGNKDVKIEESQDKENMLSFYSVMSNSIIIANIKDTFTRIQTIAHECLHSVQNRKMLLFNFVFSNIYLLYFGIICVLTIFKVIKQPMYQIVILLLLGIIYYAVRSYLETDAMTRAPYLAKEYIQESNKLSNEDIQKVMQNYEILNKMGIPMTNFSLIVSVLVKVIIYCVIAIVV